MGVKKSIGEKYMRERRWVKSLWVKSAWVTSQWVKIMWVKSLWVKSVVLRFMWVWSVEENVRSEIFYVRTVECGVCSVGCEVYVCSAKIEV